MVWLKSQYVKVESYFKILSGVTEVRTVVSEVTDPERAKPVATEGETGRECPGQDGGGVVVGSEEGQRTGGEERG